MSRRHVLMLVALAALWGASFMFIKICVRELAPTTLVCLRLGIGAIALAPLAIARLGVRQFVRETRSRSHRSSSSGSSTRRSRSPRSRGRRSDSTPG